MTTRPGRDCRSGGQGKGLPLFGLSTARRIGLLSISAGTGAGLLRFGLRRPVHLHSGGAIAGLLRYPLQFQLEGLLGGVSPDVLRPRVDLSVRGWPDGP